MYSRKVEDQVLEFGVSGMLMRNVLVMYDRQTESLWPQLLGKAVEGPLAGAELEYLPSRLTTWSDWKERHPETVALVKGYSGNRDPYASYYRSKAAGVIGESVFDDRVATKEFVIGVVHGEVAKAYPYSALNEQPVVNDELGGRPLLVVFDVDSGSGAVFDRRVDGQILEFEGGQRLELTDVGSGSRWDGLAGRAIAGPMEGTQLKPVRSTAAFWFGWKDIYPGTEVFQP